MKSQTIPMSSDEFHVMPQKLGWKYEYWDGAAHISPSYTAIAVAAVPVTPRPMHPPCLIRQVQPEDLPLLEPAYLDAFADTIDYCDYSLERIIESAQENLQTFFAGKRGQPMSVSRIALVADAEKPIAIGVANIVEKPNGIPFLDLLFVVPEWQGKGVATALVGTALNLLHAMDKPILKSRYMLGNEGSRLWHQHFGFVEEMSLFVVRNYYYHALHEWERHKALGDLTDHELAKLAAIRDEWERRVEEVEAQSNEYGSHTIMPKLD